MEFERRSNKYLYKKEYLNRLEMNNLSGLLSMKDVIILNENWLLNVLIEWYKFKMTNDGDVYNKNNEFESEFKKLIEDGIDKEKIDENKIDGDAKEVLKRLNIELKKKESIKYIDLYKIHNENILNIIINCYKEEEDKTEFNNEEKEMLDKVKEEELDNIIISLLEIKKVKLTEIALMIIMIKNVKIESIK